MVESDIGGVGKLTIPGVFPRVVVGRFGLELRLRHLAEPVLSMAEAVSDSLYALASSQALALALSGNLIDEKIHTLPLSPVGLRRCALCVAP